MTKVPTLVSTLFFPHSNWEHVVKNCFVLGSDQHNTCALLLMLESQQLPSSVLPPDNGV